MLFSNYLFEQNQKEGILLTEGLFKKLETMKQYSDTFHPDSVKTILTTSNKVLKLTTKDIIITKLAKLIDDLVNKIIVVMADVVKFGKQFKTTFLSELYMVLEKLRNTLLKHIKLQTVKYKKDKNLSVFSV